MYILHANGLTIAKHILNYTELGFNVDTYWINGVSAYVIPQPSSFLIKLKTCSSSKL